MTEQQQARKTAFANVFGPSGGLSSLFTRPNNKSLRISLDGPAISPHVVAEDTSQSVVQLLPFLSSSSALAPPEVQQQLERAAQQARGRGRVALLRTIVTLLENTSSDVQAEEHTGKNVCNRPAGRAGISIVVPKSPYAGEAIQVSEAKDVGTIDAPEADTISPAVAESLPKSGLVSPKGGELASGAAAAPASLVSAFWGMLSPRSGMANPWSGLASPTSSMASAPVAAGVDCAPLTPLSPGTTQGWEVVGRESSAEAFDQQLSSTLQGAAVADFREQFLRSAALEILLQSYLVQPPEGEEAHLLTELFQRCLTSSAAAQCQGLSQAVEKFASAIARDEVSTTSVQALSDVVLQAVASLKASADLEVLDARALKLQQQLRQLHSRWLEVTTESAQASAKASPRQAVSDAAEDAQDALEPVIAQPSKVDDGMAAAADTATGLTEETGAAVAIPDLEGGPEKDETSKIGEGVFLRADAAKPTSNQLLGSPLWQLAQQIWQVSAEYASLSSQREAALVRQSAFDHAALIQALTEPQKQVAVRIETVNSTLADTKTQLAAGAERRAERFHALSAVMSSTSSDISVLETRKNQLLAELSKVEEELRKLYQRHGEVEEERMVFEEGSAQVLEGLQSQIVDLDTKAAHLVSESAILKEAQLLVQNAQQAAAVSSTTCQKQHEEAKEAAWNSMQDASLRLCQLQRVELEHCLEQMAQAARELVDTASTKGTEDADVHQLLQVSSYLEAEGAAATILADFKHVIEAHRAHTSSQSQQEDASTNTNHTLDLNASKELKDTIASIQLLQKQYEAMERPAAVQNSWPVREAKHSALSIPSTSSTSVEEVATLRALSKSRSLSAPAGSAVLAATDDPVLLAPAEPNVALPEPTKDEAVSTQASEPVADSVIAAAIPAAESAGESAPAVDASMPITADVSADLMTFDAGAEIPEASAVSEVTAPDVAVTPADAQHVAALA